MVGGRRVFPFWVWPIRRVFFSWIRYFWMSSLRVTHRNTTRKQKNGSRMFKASSLLQTSMTIPWKSNTIFCGLVYEAPFILSRNLSSSKMNHHVLDGGWSLLAGERRWHMSYAEVPLRRSLAPDLVGGNKVSLPGKHFDSSAAEVLPNRWDFFFDIPIEARYS